MLLGETIRISLSSIWSNLFRTLLTMLGIIIGVAAVITMVALGTGAQRQIDEQVAISSRFSRRPGSAAASREISGR